MIEKKENLSLDVFDYEGNKICNLYDNRSSASGQAYNVLVAKERNGWKEQTFDIPGVINTDSGTEENYRVQYIVAEYKIRLTDDDGVDWYILSEPKVSHNGKAKKYSVKAGHVCQMLKTKNMSLEFSDEEGNNTGTIRELIERCIEGTGWQIGVCDSDDFTEEDNVTTKVRSIVAPTKTGAFSLIAKVCEAFDAKPEYIAIDDTTRYVNIKHLNPFEQPDNNTMPEAATNENTIELHYGHALKNVTRTLNTDDMVTKLYAYGSYGDKTSGLCHISEQTHTMRTFTFDNDINPGEEARVYYNTFAKDGQGNIVTTHHFKYFIAKQTIHQHSRVEYSLLDPASMMYVWDLENNIALPVTEYSQLGSYESPHTGTGDGDTDGILETQVHSYADFLMDFTYYQNVGLLTDDQLQAIATYQRETPAYRLAVQEATNAFSADIQEISEAIGGDIKYCKLDVGSTANNGSYLKLNLQNNKIIYRTDYYEKPSNYFKWKTASKLKANGDPVDTVASMVYIIHPKSGNNPVEWVKGYLKEIAGDYDFSKSGDVSGVASITLWLPNDTEIRNGDRFYLFQTFNVNGNLGVLEATDESTMLSLNSALKDVTVEHKVYFQRSEPPIDNNILKGYGWWWKYNRSFYNTKSTLYFCYYDEGDTAWHKVWYNSGNVSANGQSISDSDYWYQWQERKLYRAITPEGSNSRVWQELDSTDEKNIVSLFGTIYNAGWTRDQLYKGVYQQTAYPDYEQQRQGERLLDTNKALPAGNYALYNGYHKYQLFTTTSTAEAGSQIIYDNKYDTLTIHTSGVDQVVEVENIRPDAAKYHASNIMKGAAYVQGKLNNNGVDTNNASGENYYRSGYIPVVGLTKYIVEGITINNSKPLKVYTYDENKTFIQSVTIKSPTNNVYSFTTESINKNTEDQVTHKIVKRRVVPKYIRMYYPGSMRQLKIHAENYSEYLIIKEQTYRILNDPKYDGGDLANYNNSNILGITHLIEKFANKSDEAYNVSQPAVNTAQNNLKEQDAYLVGALGDIYREGYWSEDSYVDGDEKRLYNDALKNLKQIAKPKATYKIDYLHLNTSQEDDSWWSASENLDSYWPKISIDSAIHLIDPEIDINIWAYVDKIKQCYDLPWKTTVDINTDLSTIGQKTFADVLAQIAEVTNHAKSSLSVYDRAKVFNQDGVLDADFLEGKISANKLLIEGGSSSWKTDARGNMVFVSSDGTSAMTLTGNGFAIANTKNDDGDWNWRTFGTGDGFTADEIVAGTIDAENINVINLNADNINTGTINGFLVGEGTIGGGALSAEVQLELDKGGEALNIIGDTSTLQDKHLIDLINEANQAAADAAAIAGAPSMTTIGNNQPANPEAGDYWIDTTNGNVLKKYNVTTGTWEVVNTGGPMSAADAANAAITEALDAQDAADAVQAIANSAQSAASAAQEDANRALAEASNAYQASNGKNRITYWNGQADPTAPFPSTPRPIAGDVCVRTDLHNDLYVYSGDTNNVYTVGNWVLTSAGALYGTKFNMDSETGNINVTAATNMNIASNAALNLQSGTVNIGGQSGVNIASTASVNIAGGTVDVTGGTIDINGGQINMDSNSTTVSSGTFDQAAADITVGMQTFKIGAAGATIDDWTSSGGRNFIYNSAANLSSTSGWVNSGCAIAWNTASDAISSITSTPSNYANLYGDTVNAFSHVVNSGMSTTSYIRCKNMVGKITQPGLYTWHLNLFIASDALQKLGADTDSDPNYIQVCVAYKDSNESNWVRIGSMVYYSSVDGNIANHKALVAGWNSLSCTFEITNAALASTVTDLELFIYSSNKNSNGAGKFLFTESKLEKGAAKTIWSPAPEDGDPRLGAAWTEIDQDMNKISLSATKVTTDQYNSGSLLLTSDELKVDFNNTTLMRVKNDEATFNVDTVTVNGHLSADVVNTQPAAEYTITSANNSFGDQNKWISNLGKTLTGTVTIRIQDVISGTIYLNGFKCANNEARFEIIFSGNGLLMGSIYCYDCDRIAITGQNSSTPWTDERDLPDVRPTTRPYGLYFGNCSYVNVTGIFVDMSETTSSSTIMGIRLSGGSHVYCERCNVVGGEYGWYASNCCLMSVHNCIGGCNSSDNGYQFTSHAVVSVSGSVTHVSGSHRPVGLCQTSLSSGTITVYSQSAETPGIDDDSTLDFIANYDSYTKMPIQSSNSTTGTSFISKASNPASADTSQTVVTPVELDGAIRSGHVSKGYYYGYWYFGNTLKTDIDSGHRMDNIRSATLTITRCNWSGNNTNRFVNLYWYTTNQSGPTSSAVAPATFCNTLIQSGVEIKLGQTVQIPLTGTQLNQLKSKSVAGVCVCGNSFMEFLSCDISLVY